jgi:hypothetical protein
MCATARNTSIIESASSTPKTPPRNANSRLSVSSCVMRTAEKILAEGHDRNFPSGVRHRRFLSQNARDHVQLSLRRPRRHAWLEPRDGAKIAIPPTPLLEVVSQLPRLCRF